MSSRKKRQLPDAAPPYHRLDDEHYRALTEAEKIRHDLHQDIDAIIDAIPYAELDKEAVGFGTGHGYDGVRGRSASVECEVCRGDWDDCPECGGAGRIVTVPEYSDPTSVTAFRNDNDRAALWLAEAKDVQRRIRSAANTARVEYGFDPERGRPERSRPAQIPERIPEVESCAFCGDPAPAGRDADGKPLLRRVGDDLPVHVSTCYWTLTSQARRAGISLTAQLQQVRAQRAQHT